MDFTSFDRLVDERAAASTEDLIGYCRIPSETGCPEPLQTAAAWTAERLKRSGARVDRVELGGAPPLVLGEIGAGDRTVICVQHYDVVPAVPLELWTTPPFEPAVRDGHLFARGASDNKGSFLARLHAVEAWQECFGELPCCVRFLVEGEEESGSRHLDELLAMRPRFLEADAALNETGYIDPQGRPIITCGLRGMLYAELSVRSLARDIHSEMAMLLPNAAERLSRALATLKNGDGGVLIPGFYDDVREPTTEQLAHLRQAPFEEAALKELHGTSAFVGDRTGFDALVATMFEPTCNISGIWAGWNGADMKTVIPAEAHAKLDMRLIPDQDPQRILQCLRSHFAANGYDDIGIRIFAHESPWWTPVSHPLAKIAAAASEAIVGSQAIRIMSSMSTAPMYPVCSPNRLPAVGFGCTHPDSRGHAPDENMNLALMRKATKVFGRFLAGFAEMPSSPV